MDQSSEATVSAGDVENCNDSCNGMPAEACGCCCERRGLLMKFCGETCSRSDSWPPDFND